MNLLEIQNRILIACQRAFDGKGRSAKDVQLLAVSKMQPDDLVEQAYLLGLRHFGENYVQELMRKREKFIHLSEIKWHLIGPLQTNKIKIALESADFFHALESIKTLNEIERRSAKIEVGFIPWQIFIQVNIENENTKAGVSPAALPEFVKRVLATHSLCLRGFMIIPAAKENPEHMRTVFREMKLISNKLEQKWGRPFELSMGMSNDFEIAIEEGAHWVRIGRSLFGDRIK